MFTSLVLLLAAAQTSETLNQIGRGKLQCYLPDVETRTCVAIASYAKQTDGSWINVADQIAPMPSSPRMVTRTRVTIDGDTICGPIKRDDILRSEFIAPTGRLSPEDAERMAMMIADAMASVLDRVICTRYKYQDGAIIAEISIDGVRQSSLDEPIGWIDANSGYVLRPRMN